MEKIRNLSIKKTIILYMSVSLLASFLTAAVVMQIAKRTQKQIWSKYVDTDDYDSMKSRFWNEAPRPSGREMTRMDGMISEACDFLETYGILVISVLGSILAVCLFYRDKIKVPLEELSAASRMIANNELDFKVTYLNRDELGRLCAEFEKMRGELEKSERRMWHMAEEEKTLRAAAAHDIRTPLSILRGYQEMLLEFVPKGELEQDKLVEMLEEGMKQIGRIDRFVETMRTLAGMENREVRYEETNIAKLGQQIEKNGSVMAEGSGRKLTVSSIEADQQILVDTDLVLEVTENILSNALRYAGTEVAVFVSLSAKELEILVKDDGNGFSVSAVQAMEAYYHSNPQDDRNHSGLGMYISRVLCEKHGGRLLAGNQENGGAVVKAVFKLGKPD